MKTKLVAIGNSRGVRIPAQMIRDAGLEAELEISLSDGAIVLRAARKPRAGWAEALDALPADERDVDLDGFLDFANEFDESADWTWG